VKAGKHCSSPAGDDIFDEKEELGEPVSRSEYMGLVMTLMYIARLTRPDILIVVTYQGLEVLHEGGQVSER
jgi:hypothetical protein